MLKQLTFGSNNTRVWDISFNGTDLTEIKLNNSTVWESYLDYTLSGSSYSVKVRDIEDLPSDTITIPETFNGIAVKKIASNGFKNCTKLKHIVIPKSITSIAVNAFVGCTNLEDFTVDSQSTSYTAKNGNLYNKSEDTLVRYAIGKTDSSFTLPNTVKIIEDYAFNQSKLTSVSLTDTVTEIGEYSFEKCESLNSIQISNNVTTIGRNAFSNCSELTTANLGNGISIIDRNTFYGCSKLSEFSIPDTVTILHDYAFRGCTSLKSIEIPDSVETIYNHTFANCSGLETIIFGTGLSKIAAYAFMNCSKLTHIDLPASVTSISLGAFGGCSSLEFIKLPFVGSSKDAGSASDTTLFGYIFGDTPYTGGTETTQYYNFGQSKSYYIPSKLSSVEIVGGNILYGAFYNCTNIGSVAIDGVNTIGKYAFRYCSKLSRLVIGSSVSTISAYALENCSNLSYIELPFTGTDKSATDYTSHFGYIFGYTTYTYPNQPSDYQYYDESTNGYYVYKIPTSLTHVKLNSGAKYHSFRNCKTITKLELSSSSSTEYAALENCSNLQYLSLYNKFKRVKNTDFTKITYDDSGQLYTSDCVFDWDIGGEPQHLGFVFGKGLCSWETQSSYNAGKAHYVIDYGKKYKNNSNAITALADWFNYDRVTDTTTFNTCYTYAIPSTLKEVVLFTDSAGMLSWNPTNASDVKFMDGAQKFRNCTNIEKITIKSQLYSATETDARIKSLPYQIFYGCTSLNHYRLPTDKYYDGKGYLESIGQEAFYKCSQLKTVDLPNSVIKIGSFAFNQSGLEQINIPKDSALTTIDQYAFGACTKLAYLYIPKNVTTVGHQIVYNMSSTANPNPDFTIKCAGAAAGSDWHTGWNSQNYPVVWNYDGT